MVSKLKLGSWEVGEEESRELMSQAEKISKLEMESRYLRRGV